MIIYRLQTTFNVEFLPFASLSGSGIRGLLQRAIAVRQNAQAPYSNFKVGAAVMSQTGNIFVGCNVERAHYIVSHAERTAIDAMVAGGANKKIKIIAIAAAPADQEFNLSPREFSPESLPWWNMVAPCGDCRQVIWENCFGDKSALIFSLTTQGGVFRTTIGDLLPVPFDLGDVYR